MQKVKLTILKDHEASPDGINLVSFKKGESFDLGEPKFTLNLYQWHSRNSGYGELSIEEKAIATAPENKMLEASKIENKRRK